eukprot:gene19453-966_t
MSQQDHLPEGAYVDPIEVAGSLDIPALHRVASDSLREALEMIMCKRSFIRLMRDERVLYSSRTLGTRPIFSPFLAELERSAVIESVPRKCDLLCSAPLFLVEKEAPKMRVVVDCRPLNRLLKKPPPITTMPSPRGLMDAIQTGRYKFLWQSDFRHWFYQFSIHEDIRQWFGVRLRPADSPNRRFRMKVLAMGFSYAPFIAQETSEFLTSLAVAGHEGSVKFFVCYDNVMVLATSREIAQTTRAKFVTVCGTYRAQLKCISDVSPRDVFCGVEVDLDRCAIRPAEKTWVKLMDALAPVPESLSLLKTWELMGILIWILSASLTPLCILGSFLALVSKSAHAAIALQLRDPWNQYTVSFPATHRQVLHDVRARFQDHPWTSAINTQKSCTVWTDASNNGFGVVIEYRGRRRTLAGLFRSLLPAHIFHKELWAAVRGVQRVLEWTGDGCAILLYVDNMAVRGAIRKTHSSNEDANRLLSALFTLLERTGSRISKVEYIASEDNPADEPSRRLCARL